ncbi:hypothetical protein [Streptomyces sp. LN785]|uniref:hypothetical protein n=1 Tax=Streptomyces sp. LN785 TaxID=3112983 RepID=UPI00371B17DE
MPGGRPGYGSSSRTDAAPGDKWLVGLEVWAPGSTFTWRYYVIDQACDAMQAAELAIRRAVDEVCRRCVRGVHGTGRLEIQRIHDDGIGRKHLLRCF